jgi:thymidylate synthase ThyX
MSLSPEVERWLKEEWKGYSPPPRVTLISASYLPYEEVVASAKTCYSGKGVIYPEEILKKKNEEGEKIFSFSQDLYKAGHHTVFQHSYFTFALENVSRLFVWAFLHNHPFYNSEQVSQRYVRVRRDFVYIPEDGNHPLYHSLLDEMHNSYEEFINLLLPWVRERFYERFPSRKEYPHLWEKTVLRKCQEIARYLLPIGTLTYLHHTISGLTLLRYSRSLSLSPVRKEARYIVARMVEEVGKVSPDFVRLIEPPLPEEEIPWEKKEGSGNGDPSVVLLSYTTNGEELVAQALTEITGVSYTVEMAENLLHPKRTPALGESLNLTSYHPLLHPFKHLHYVFRKRLSHVADSQNQRHRLTPASRPLLFSKVLTSPDFIYPRLVAEIPILKEKYRLKMEEIWDKLCRLFREGVSLESLSYLLPNGVAVEIVESADFLSLYHKHRMRLCYNAQEEIFHLSLKEATLVTEVHPHFGKYLLPPCSIRNLRGARPICPEGSRFCGVKVWALPREKYLRTL